MSISLDGGISLAGNSLGGGGGNTTLQFITDLEPQHFYRLAQEAGAVNFGDVGVGPAGIPIIASPTFANSVPMAAEPFTTAALFDGVNDRGLRVGDVDGFDTGTLFLFFNLAATLSATARVYGQEDVNTATRFMLHFLDDDTCRMFLSRDGAATNVYTSAFDFSAFLTFNTWHMLAARQAGAGVTWFFDGNFFTVADSEVTESTLGNLDNTAWLAETLVAAAPATRRVLGADVMGNGPYPGQAFNIVSDDRVWTDAELTDLWNLANTNGLV